MKSSKTIRRDNYKRELRELLDKHPEAHEVAKRYKVMRWLLNNEWENTLSHISADSLELLLQDIVYLDRQIRLATEGEDVETKEVLSQEVQIHLGYGPNYEHDVKMLKTL